MIRIFLINSIKGLVLTLLIINLASARPSDESLASWGYKPVNLLTYNLKLCASAIPQNIQLIGIKSLKPIQAEENTFYRFTLGEESFASLADQQNRLNELRKPVTGNSLISKSCNLIQFFNCKNQIYFVHTDSLLSIPELDRIKALYQRETCADSDS